MFGFGPEGAVPFGSETVVAPNATGFAILASPGVALSLSVTAVSFALARTFLTAAARDGEISVSRVVAVLLSPRASAEAVMPVPMSIEVWVGLAHPLGAAGLRSTSGPSAPERLVSVHADARRALV